MEALGVNNNTQMQFPIDKKVYYSFLNTPYDSVQISQNHSNKKQDQKENNEFKQVANIIDPKKNYKRISAKIAGIAGASALIGGLILVSVLRGKSGSSEKLTNLLQKLRGQAYNLREESSHTARIKYGINTRITSLLEGGLNTWTNTDQLKNLLLDKKLMPKLGILKKPIYWTVDVFRNGAKLWAGKKYNNSIKDAKKLQELAPDLMNAVQGQNNFISNKEIVRLNKKFPGLDLRTGETRAQVIKKLIDKITLDTEEFGGKANFQVRQQKVDKRLEKVVDDYSRKFHIFSDSKGDGGIIETFKQAANTIKTSKNRIISREDQKAFEETKKEVYGTKELISRNINDNYGKNMELLKQVENHIIEASKGNGKIKVKYTTNYSDIIRNLEREMKHYKESRTSAGIIARKGAIKNYEEQAVNFIEAINKGDFSPEEKTQIIEKLNNSIRTIENDDQKGMVQELRDLLKCTDENGVNTIKRDHNDLYTSFKNKTDKLSKSINKAAKFESDNLFYRFMDLKLGGGDFEIITLAIPVGAGLHQISKTKDHDEKVSKTIRKSAVIGGGILGWALSSVVLCLSGGTSLLFGLMFGFTADKVGESIDNKFWSKGRDWKAIHKQQKLAEKRTQKEQQKQKTQVL